MVSALDPWSSGRGSSPGWRHRTVLLKTTLYSAMTPVFAHLGWHCYSCVSFYFVLSCFLLNLTSGCLFSCRPSAVMALFLWTFQRTFFSRWVFRDRDFPNLTVTIDNRYVSFLKNLIPPQFLYLLIHTYCLKKKNGMLMSRLKTPPDLSRTEPKQTYAEPSYSSPLPSRCAKVEVMFCIRMSFPSLPLTSAPTPPLRVGNANARKPF